MGFGEEYQDMTDREILIEVVGELKALKTTVESRPQCPSPMCGDHDRRITRLETIVTVVGGAVCVMVPVLMWILDRLWARP
ncbi:MAG: hypothetical protein GXX95_01170 [Methanomassiliicoccus sp.]|nr:hypothetical protein [Methanomassiliicoccus sp.]